jgi:GNAT superfamily N-acetyltransferase
MPDLSFRPARADEASQLGGLVMAGVRHWGHDVSFPEPVADLEANHLPTPEYVEESPVFVLEEDDRRVGFYGLRVHDDFVDLVYMFVDPDRIGGGLGRVLWDHAITEASQHGSRMRILSDPGAVGFYAAMGAELEKDIEVSPGFRLGLFWYPLE